MHFVVSWDINAQGAEWNQHNEGLKTVLKPYSWARPLTTFYIVNVPSQQEFDFILNSLTQYSQSFPGKINIVMSPLMSGGRYNGVLPQNMWDEINSRSN